MGVLARFEEKKICSNTQNCLWNSWLLHAKVLKEITEVLKAKLQGVFITFPVGNMGKKGKGHK